MLHGRWWNFVWVGWVKRCPLHFNKYDSNECAGHITNILQSDYRQGIVAVEGTRTSSSTHSMATIDPSKGLFHFFISYRVAHQSDFSLKLHDRLNLKASITPIPLVESAQWPPEFERQPYVTSSNGAHVFLDQRCLPNAEDWFKMFVEALKKSMVFVPLLSCSKNVNLSQRDKLVQSIDYSIQSEIESLDSGVIDTPELNSAKDDKAAARIVRMMRAKPRADDNTQVYYTGSMGDFVKKNPNSRDKGVKEVDNFLLELILAKELHMLHDIAKKRKELPCVGENGTLNTCSKIFPIIIGSFPSDPFTDNVCTATNEKAKAILQDVFKLQPSTEIDTYSAKRIFKFFLGIQGNVLSNYGKEDHALDVVCGNLIQCCCNIIPSSIRSSMLARENPLSFEMQDWLKANRAFHILHILAVNDIHSVRSLSFLKDTTAVWKLASEISAVTGKTILHETAFVLELLELARSSKLSMSLSQRIATFVDDDASSLSIIYSASAFDIGFGKPSWRFVFLSAGIVMAISGLLQDLSPLNWQETWFNLSVAGSLVFTAVISQFVSPFAGRKFCSFSFLFMIIAIIIGWLVDKFSSGNFDFANCFRCTAVYESGPYASFSCRLADTGTAALYVMLTLFMFFMMSNKQSKVWRTWIFLTVSTSVFYCVEIALCTPHPVPSALYTTPTVNFIACFILFVSTEFLRNKAQTLARDKSKGDDDRRIEKWNTLSTKEEQALSEFCNKTKSDKLSILIPICQESSSIDELYFIAQISNAMFQDCFTFLVSKSNTTPESLTLCSDLFQKRLTDAKEKLEGVACELTRGPVKRPDRAISKVYRAYAGNVSRLTDLVRCSISFKSFSEMQKFVEALFSICNVPVSDDTDSKHQQKQQHPFNTRIAPDSNAEDSKQQQKQHLASPSHPLRPHWNQYKEQHPSSATGVSVSDDKDPLFVIERIRNRFATDRESSSAHRDFPFVKRLCNIFAPPFQESTSAYRDFSIKVKIGLKASTEHEGRYIFVPFSEWHDRKGHRNKNVHLFICEVQLHHSDIQLDDESGLVHDNYVAMRNLVSS
jgi:hypothetical protein